VPSICIDSWTERATASTVGAVIVTVCSAISQSASCSGGSIARPSMNERVYSPVLPKCISAAIPAIAFWYADSICMWPPMVSGRISAILRSTASVWSASASNSSSRALAPTRSPPVTSSRISDVEVADAA
jgi:hypothetical protein